MEHRKFQTLNINDLWQCRTTQKSIIIKLSAFGKLSYIKFLSIRINQVNLNLSFCVVLLSNMAFCTEFYPEIFHFEIQKKHGKHLKFQKIFWIYMSNTIFNLIIAELKIFLQYKPSTVADFFLSILGLWWNTTYPFGQMEGYTNHDLYYTLQEAYLVSKTM